MAAQPVPPVEADGPRGLKPAHPAHEIGLRGLQQKMIMVAHQHERMKEPAGAPACLVQRLKKKLAILVIMKNRFPPVTTVEHVVNRSGELNSRFSGHAWTRIMLAARKMSIRKD